MTLKWVIYTNYFILVFIHPCKVSATALAASTTQEFRERSPAGALGLMSSRIVCVLLVLVDAIVTSTVQTVRILYFFFISPPLYNVGACWYKHSNTTIRIETLKKTAYVFFAKMVLINLFSLKCCKKNPKHESKSKFLNYLSTGKKKPN